MMRRHGATLQEIGSYFGFSREYARQVYNKLSHGSYRAHRRQREQAIMAR
jgi:DNA-directed RNA polymerase sigma subunit (sigma70/sigma32)